MKPTFTEVVDRLYTSEINVGFQSFWDGGFTVWVGDHINGEVARRACQPGGWEAAAEWLDLVARAHYPGRYDNTWTQAR